MKNARRGGLGQWGNEVLPIFRTRPLTQQALAILLAGLLLTVPCIADEPSNEPAVLQGRGFTLFAGYQFGGGFTDQAGGQSIALRESGSFGASLDLPLDGSSELQVFYNHQSTEFTPWPYPNSSDRLRLDYAHVGGTYFPDGLGYGIYVAGGVGATRITPDAGGLNPATKLSMNLGLGYLLPLSKNIGLRVEARGFFTAIGGYTSVFCSGGCVASLTASGVSQGDFLIGLSARF
jgi:hypothetical protein